mmetsp:Transcript_41082/g.85760  ORF Transcript_41082/g.85760 Transcript_41082/m.85760 type:complete len:90 (+) Transcript_41082:1964-2233(+)
MLQCRVLLLLIFNLSIKSSHLKMNERRWPACRLTEPAVRLRLLSQRQAQVADHPSSSRLCFHTEQVLLSNEGMVKELQYLKSNCKQKAG